MFEIIFSSLSKTTSPYQPRHGPSSQHYPKFLCLHDNNQSKWMEKANDFLLVMQFAEICLVLPLTWRTATALTHFHAYCNRTVTDQIDAFSFMQPYLCSVAVSTIRREIVFFKICSSVGQTSIRNSSYLYFNPLPEEVSLYMTIKYLYCFKYHNMVNQ